ncbi:mechanosensitive ion channel [bacterium]|nr:mechanosensitive ion channel [bacterium]
MLAWWLQVQTAQAQAETAAEDGGAPVVADEASAAEASGDTAVAPDAAESLGSVAQTLHKSVIGDKELAGDMLGFAGITPLEWTWGIGCLLLAIIMRWVVLLVLNRYLQPIVQRSETEYDDRVLLSIKRAVGIFILLGGFFLVFTFIQFTPEIQAIIWRVLNTLIIVNLVILAYRIAEIFLHFISHKREDQQKSVLDEQFFPLLRDIVKFVAIILAIVAIVQSWGGNASGILAGVGVGGLALAFAAQDTVANIFGSFVIYSDRPYKVGDWIKMGNVEGTVEEIGIRSTRIRCFDKTMMLVPNKKVANEDIQNFSEMPVRRLKLTVGLSYDASADQIKAIVEDTRRLLATHPGIDQTFWIVNFTDMSDYSLDLLVYCFTTTTVWKEYLDIRQDVLLNILDICNRHKVEIAFPTQTIYYRGGDEPPYTPSLTDPRRVRRPTPSSQPLADPAEPQAEFNTADGDNGG